MITCEVGSARGLEWAPGPCPVLGPCRGTGTSKSYELRRDAKGRRTRDGRRKSFRVVTIRWSPPLHFPLISLPLQPEGGGNAGVNRTHAAQAPAAHRTATRPATALAKEAPPPVATRTTEAGGSFGGKQEFQGEIINFRPPPPFHSVRPLFSFRPVKLRRQRPTSRGQL